MSEHNNFGYIFTEDVDDTGRENYPYCSHCDAPMDDYYRGVDWFWKCTNRECGEMYLQ